MYIRFPLSLRQVEDLLHERGIDICHETVRAWWNRFGPMFAAEIRFNVHHTLGGPIFRERQNVDYADFWKEEFQITFGRAFSETDIIN